MLYNCYQDGTFSKEDMINPLLVLTLLKIISLDINGITNSTRNPIICDEQSSCIGYTILSSCRIVLIISEAIVIGRSFQHQECKVAQILSDKIVDC